MSEENEEKTSEASDQKLSRLRAEGQVPNISRPLALCVTLSVLTVIFLTARIMLEQIARLFDSIFLVISAKSFNALSVGLEDFSDTMWAVFMPFLSIGVASTLLFGIGLHRGLIFSMKSLNFDFNKMNPVKNAKEIFGRRAWIELASSVVMLLIWTGAVGALVWSYLGEFVSIQVCGVYCFSNVSLSVVGDLVKIVLFLMVVFAILETRMQIAIYRHENRMTKTEVKREQKDNFGAPAVRAERRRLQQMTEVANQIHTEHVGASKANMCIFSTEGAIGISYHPDIQPLPIISVKAKGAETQKLRAYIRKRGFAECRNDRLTAACLRQAEGSGVPPSHYSDLAEAINSMYA